MITPTVLLLAVQAFADTSTRPQSRLPTRFDYVTWDNDNWVLHNTLPDPLHYQSRPSLSNGYIGTAVSSIGPFFEADILVAGSNTNGWPLIDRRQTFSTIAGFYDVQAETSGSNFEWLNQLGGESVISGIPHWAGLHVKVDDHTLDASTDLDQITNFRSFLDMKRALFSWNYTWTPPAGCAMDLEYSMFIHRLYVNRAAVQLRITPHEDVTVDVIDKLDGDGALRTQNAVTGYDQNASVIWSSVQPHWIPYVTGHVFSTMVWSKDVEPGSREIISVDNMRDKKPIGQAPQINGSTISQTTSFKLKAGQTTSIAKFLGVASHDAFETPELVAREASKQGASEGFDKQLESHIKEWQSEFVEEKIDDYSGADGVLPDDPNIVETQITAVSNPFQLLLNIVSPNAIKQADNNDKLDVFSIAVCGLQSECYAGLVFWDVEVWMQPGLVVSYPEAGRQIANYRAEKYEQAGRNVKTNFITSQANKIFSPDSIVYPWTSGRFGNCTGTGPCFDYEYHLNGDINLELENYLYTSGDVKTFREKYFPIYNGVGQLYTDLLDYNKTLDAYTLSNATDPDEYANHVNNAAFTMALIDQILNSTNNFRKLYGEGPLEPVRPKIYLPTDDKANIILEYSEMNGSIEVKQADVVLIDDFLEYPNKYTLSDLDFYAGHQSLDGPGMTFGVFSGIASNYMPSGCADYTYFLYSSQPYLRAPWFQFSEQINDDYDTNGHQNPAYPFLTGVGGAHRVPVYGFLGLKLRNDTFHINPSLPPQIPQIRYRTIYWQGHAIHASSNLTHTTLTRGPSDESLSTAHAEYDNGIPVTVWSKTTTYNLTRAAPLVLENERPDLKPAVDGNTIQCRPATANVTNVPGQIPLAAVDGAVSTSWQPTLANVTSTLMVDTGDATSMYIKGFHFDWAHQPPKTFSVAFANTTSPAASELKAAYSTSKVVVNSPYVAADAAKVTAYRSNTTSVDLKEPMWGGRYAFLSVSGNQDTDEMSAIGPSVAEFSILRETSESDAQRRIRAALDSKEL